MKRSVLIPVFAAILLLTTRGHLSAQQHWSEVTTVEETCAAWPEIMARMFQHFNLDYPGMEKVKTSVQQGNVVDACKHLLAYYSESESYPDLRKVLPPESDRTDATADTILTDVFLIQQVRGRLPYDSIGHRDWNYKGPHNDNEWAWLSNRHTQISDVLGAYLETGNPKYVRYIDLFLRDFIVKSLPYPAVKSSTPVWRGLEVSFRAKVWTRIFYNLMGSDYFSPSTRLLILSSLPDHAHYNRNFHGGNNWLTMELSALATIASHFPEYRGASEWMDYSIQAMTESMKEQVYPDGVQTELTSHYHNVSLRNFELFKEICAEAGKPLPEYYNKTLEDMYAYISHAVRPDGFRILNNDGDRGSDRSLILNGAKIFNKPDWTYIVTNGTSGAKPVGGPSWFFPWAGQLISRSGYDADAHWSFFDIGPWGTGHQHHDKLHLSVAAFGRDLLVDAGRFAYTGEVAKKFRPYARGSAGHNVILIDGKGQDAGPLLVKFPLDSSVFRITETFDYATGAMDRYTGVEGVAEHRRTLLYARGDFWVVVDRITTDRPRTLEALWHWHPDNRITKDGAVVKTTNDRGNLAVIPVGATSFDVTFVKGQETPVVQGWYSPEYNIFEPNTTTIYRTAVSGNTVMVWLLVPSEKETPPLKADLRRVGEEGISLRVRSAGKRWDIHVPLAGSRSASLKKR